MATSYLVRTIQRREDPAWVRHLNADPEMYIPLPFVPREPFDGVIVLHDGTAYLYELDRLVKGAGELQDCGLDGDQPVRDETRIYVRTGSMRSRKALIEGFQGIRYYRNADEVAAPGSEKGFWTYLLEVLGTPPPGSELNFEFPGLAALISAVGFATTATAVEIVLRYHDPDFPFAWKVDGPSVTFRRK